MEVNNMRILNICIDIDGTITEPYYWLTLANQYFKTQLKPKDITIYEIHKLLGVAECEYNEFYYLFGELLHKEAMIRSGAKEIINKLSDHHLIHFVSARDEKMREVTLEWLDKHQIPMDSITLLGSSEKVHQAETLSCDIFIEDRYENAIQLAQAGFEVLLIDCNYNKGVLPSNVARVRTWLQIDKIIENRFHSYNELELAL
jgi:uncharacterized HAD superfamily protein